MLRRQRAGHRRWIGKLLDWLETSGHKDDTVVIFCADHGELLGDHGLLEKSCMYEGCLRIPLLGPPAG